MIKKITFLILLVSFTLQAQIPTGYYDHATGASYTLKTQLKRIINSTNDPEITVNEYFHSPQSYGDLWSLYETSDSRPNPNYDVSIPANGPEFYVWEMYSDCDFIFGPVASGGQQDNGTLGNSECQLFNREHTFPRSWYGDGSNHPMKSDAFHVIPSDKYTNGQRGNLAYSEVNTSLSHSSPGTAFKGTSSISGPTGTVFEPADQYKGDIARGLLYVAVRYEDEIAGWETNDSDGDSMLDGTSNKVFEQWAIDMLYSWHVNDPVSQKEIDRNNAIYNFQSNRNPFIDHPEYVAEIWGSVLAVDDYVANDFSIYPNPTHADIVYINKGNNTIKNLELYSISGKLILSKKINTSHSTITLDNLNSVASGMYLLKIQTDKNTVIKKLVIN
ncbi:MAG: endonuclease [Flavobacteriaceae bacterium]